MANLIVRGIDEALVQALKQRAAKHGRSVEGEHREIFASASRPPASGAWQKCWLQFLT
jgi:plasmid stability protein